MNLSKYILPLPFIVSFSIGMLMCYILAPEPEIVFKHPNPNNVETTIYKNGDKDCYKYEVQEVSCPKNMDNVKEHPVNK